MPGYVDGVYPANMSNPDLVMQGAISGVQQYTSVVTGGMQRFVSDLGRMMPAAPSTRIHPYIQARHGMYGHEMTMSGDVGAMFGMGTPETTTRYEYQAMAREDFSRRIGNAVTFGTLHGGAAAASWFGGGAMLAKGVKGGFKAGKAMAAARGLGAIGAGVAGGLGAVAGALPAMAAFTAIDATVGKIVEDVQDRQDIMNYLEASSFRYMQSQGSDTDSKFGAGFNRKARAGIAESIKKIDLQDTRYDMSDLKGVLERGTELGMFQGTQSAEDFSSKFKDLTTNLKSVTRILHQSLAEGLNTIKDLKEQGYRTPGAMQGAVMQADVLGTATGRTAAEMLSIGRQGSELVRGTGIGMATGSAMMQQTHGMLQSAMDAGTLSKEMVAQAGGIGNMSQQVMRQSLGMLNSDLGRGVMMAMGGAGGKLDVNRLSQLAGGQLSMGQILAHGTQNVSTAGGYVDAVINRGDNMRELTSKYGKMGGQMASMGMELSMAKESAKWSGKSVREMLKFNALQRGETEESIEARLAMVDNVEEFAGRQQAAFATQVRKVRGEEYRERTDIAGRISDRVDRMISPVSKAVGDVADSISDWAGGKYEASTDWLTEKITGVKKVAGKNISNKELINLFQEGAFDAKTDEREVNLQKNLKKGIWTLAEQEKFSKSDAYKSIDKNLLAKGVDFTSSAVMAAGEKGIESFSQEVFGKDWSKLSRDERMFLGAKAKEFGMTTTMEDIEGKKADSATKLKDRQAIIMSQDESSIEEKRKDLRGAREEAYDIISGKDSQRLREMGMNTLAGSEIDKLRDDPEGAKGLDSLITSSNTLRGLNEKLSNGETLTEDEQEQLSKAQESKKAAIISIKKSNKNVNVAQIMKGIEEAGGDLNRAAGMVDSASKALRKVESGKDRKQVVQGMRDRFQSYATQAGKTLKTSETKELRGILGRVFDEDEVGEGDADRLGELAKSSGITGLANLSGLVKEISGSEEHLSSKENLTKWLENRGALQGLKTSEEKEKFAQNFLSGDKLNKRKLLDFEMLRTQGDTTGGDISSGGTDGRSGEDIINRQANLSAALSKTQSETHAVLEQLRILHAQLSKKTGVK